MPDDKKPDAPKTESPTDKKPDEWGKAENHAEKAKKKLANLTKLGGVEGVNPFYAINALNKAIADLQSKDELEVKAAQATINRVTDDGKWLPAKV